MTLTNGVTTQNNAVIDPFYRVMETPGRLSIKEPRVKLQAAAPQAHTVATACVRNLKVLLSVYPVFLVPAKVERPFGFTVCL